MAVPVTGMAPSLNACSTKALVSSRLKPLLVDDVVELSCAPSVDEFSPLIIEIATGRDAVDEVHNEVPFTPQGEAGVGSALDLHDCLHFIFGATVAGLAPLLDEHEDVVDVDFDLLDELDLEDNVVVDRLLLGLFAATELGVQVEVDAAVVLALPFREQFIARELIERSQDVLQAQDCAEKGDELFLRRLTDDRLSRAGTLASSSRARSAYSA